MTTTLYDYDSRLRLIPDGNIDIWLNVICGFEFVVSIVNNASRVTAVPKAW